MSNVQVIYCIIAFVVFFLILLFERIYRKGTGSDTYEVGLFIKTLAQFAVFLIGIVFIYIVYLYNKHSCN